MTAASTASCFIHQIGTAVPTLSLDAEEAARLLQHACISSRGAKLLQRISRLTTSSGDTWSRCSIRRRSERNALSSGHDPAAAREWRREPSCSRSNRSARSSLALRLSTRNAGTHRDVGHGQLHACVLSGPRRCHPESDECARQRSSLEPGIHGLLGRPCRCAPVLIQIVTRTPTAWSSPALSSLHFQYTDELDQMTANVLFSDERCVGLLSLRPSRTRVVDCRSFGVAAVRGPDGVVCRRSRTQASTFSGTSADPRASSSCGHRAVPRGQQYLARPNRSLARPSGAARRFWMW